MEVAPPVDMGMRFDAGEVARTTAQFFVTVPGGSTLVVDAPATGGWCACDVLAVVEERTGIPASALVLMGSKRLPLVLEEPLAVGQTAFEAGLRGGLAGGKGGFGAMLRALAKQNTGHQTTDFGACRDLNGRRLRHVNNEVKLQQWTEEKERKAELARQGVEVDEDDFDQTPSGIKGWYLGVPGWIEHVKTKETKAHRRKVAGRRDWRDEEADVEEAGLATRDVRGVVTMVDTLRGGFAIVDGDVYVPFTANMTDEDWAAVMGVGDPVEVKAVLKPQGKNKWYGFKARRLIDGKAPTPPP